MSVLTARDLSVVLGGNPVLRGVSLDVQPGQLVALLGANGSGKSTLVKACLGLLPRARGDIELFGTPLASFRDWARVGYVPQRNLLTMQAATVAEVVASGRLASRVPFVPGGSRLRQRVRAALADVGLADRAKEALVTLSGGQQQRVLIARAMVSEPDLLVMDEPLAGVDHRTQATLADVIGRFVRGGGSVLVVLHELEYLAPLIDRVVVMQDGLVVADGSPEAVGITAHGHHDHRPEAVAGLGLDLHPVADRQPGKD